MGFLKFIIGVFCTIAALVSCENKSGSTLETSQHQEGFLKVFGNESYSFPALSPEASNYVSNWAVFEDFKTEAFAINGNNINQLKAGSERLIARVDSLVKKIPDTLNTKQIYARVLVVKTRAALLFQETNNVRIDTIKIQQYISEMNNATTNLIVQINGKLEKDAIDFQRTNNEKKEIALQKNKADSIFKTEVRDNQ